MIPRLLVVALAAGLQGCAMGPMTPQQQAFIQQMVLENQRAANAQAAQPGYQIVPPVQLQHTPLQGGDLQSTVTATWTGRSEVARSVTGAPGFNCEYYYAGKKFMRMFASSCPSSIQVQ